LSIIGVGASEHRWSISGGRGARLCSALLIG